MNQAIKQRIDELLKERDNSNVCISLDWLSLYFKHQLKFEKSYQEGDQIVLTEDCYLLEINRPTLHFTTHFVLFYKNEECAHVLCNSRNEKFFAGDVVKVDFVNHTLYSGQWVEIYELLQNFGLVYHAAGRVDIAIDGVNYLQELLNIYAKQSVRNRTMILKNSSELRARFHAKVLNTKTMLFENFNIGAHGGNKMITVYNKSLEIVKSGKKYIQDFWLKNGVIQPSEQIDLPHQSEQLKKAEKRGKETFYLKGYRNVYRFELRLKSESIKEIEGFSIKMLLTPEGLANIVRTHCKKYFEACFNDNRNVTKCTPFDLLPYNKLNARVIAKIQRVEKGGLYKAKLTVHGLIQDVYKGNVNSWNYNESIEVIFDRVAKYNLWDWLEMKLPEWDRLYINFVHKDRINDVTIIKNRIAELVEQYTRRDSYNDAINNDQASATASF